MSDRRERLRRPRAELLESRVLLASFMVSNTGDSGPGSLRQAIFDANASAPGASIVFDIPGSGTQTIAPTSQLPEITNPVTIDGTTQPGYSGTPLIELNGAAEGPGAVGLKISAGTSTVRGLAITGFRVSSVIGTDPNLSRGGFGILLTGSGNNTLESNFIGTDASQSASLGNTYGVRIENSPGNTIGGTAPGLGNLFAGNSLGNPDLVSDGGGLVIDGAGSVANLVEGNSFGLDSSGTKTLGNNSDIVLINASQNTIGGTTAGARNLIAGNHDYGIWLQGASNQNTIAGNYFGTDSTGTKAVTTPDQTFYGVFITDNSSHNTVGGTTPAARNIIAGNGAGVVLNGDGATGNTVEGNYLGTDVSGTRALGNGAGVTLAAPGNVIGGTTPGARNIISGNVWGISVYGQFYSVRGNLVEGNWIGLDATGTKPLGNTSDGIHFLTGAFSSVSGVTIGGTQPGAGNIIADNGGAGVSHVGGEAVAAFPEPRGNDNAILSNSIYANAGLGIDLITFRLIPGFGYVAVKGVTPNTPGGPHVGSNNLQNFPALTSVTSAGGSTTIQGTLNSTPSTAFLVQFFANAAPDPSGFGEGQTFIGQTTGTTDSSGNSSFSATLPVTVPPGQFVSATATDPNGNTSEFSADFPAVPVKLLISQTGPPSPVKPGQNLVFTVNLSNAGDSTATGVVVVDALPQHTSLVSATASQGTVIVSDNFVTLNVGLLAGRAQTVSLTITVAPAGTGVFTNTAAVLASQPNSNPSNTSTFSVTIQSPPKPLPPPRVVSLERRGIHNQPTQLVLTFSEPLNPASAQNLRNYLLVIPGSVLGKTHRPAQMIPIVAAIYNATTQTVTLLPSHKVDLHRIYQLIVNGMPPLGISNKEGTLLDGAGNGVAGTDYTALILGFGAI